MNNSTYSLLKRLWKYFNLQIRKKLITVSILTAITAICEVSNLISILPFVAIMTSPDKLMQVSIIKKICFGLDLHSTSDLLLPITLFFGASALLAGTFRLLLIRASLEVASDVGTDISVGIYRKTLHQPYKTHIERDSGDLISAIAQKSLAVTTIIISLITLATSSILFLSIVSTMLMVNTTVTLTSSLIIALAYLTIGKITKKNLSQNGGIIIRKQNDVIKALQEGFGAIRDIILDGLQEYYSQNYQKSICKLQKSRMENMFIGQAPRYLIESFTMIGIAVFILSASHNNYDIINTFPILGFFAISAQRLLPITQQIYGYWSEVIGNKAALSDVLTLLDQHINENNINNTQLISLEDSITLQNVSFKYHASSSETLQNLNLSFPKGSKIGIIGQTGSGKSTILDIIMGLIEPTSGKLLVDNCEISTQNSRAWQKNIAHVPQNIFLANTSIAENIAFGIPNEKIDLQRVEKAAIQAEAHEFIIKTVNQYQTNVGEKGIRLSGGQKQRIGLARALYKNAQILCLDEATSALDNATEQNVMHSINNLDNNLTIFIIAHRTTTLNNCSHLLKIEEGTGELIINKPINYELERNQNKALI
ncbi:MAG: hypothetical protein A3E88_00205 [Legionellales bacterium RIFCSPHIGHO2_12_FULL_35_11]|nr:MAG: hypothetical protein A3E88_00205 [Legionellales bacterium RIFCSPHIGHO2_12_FULL_35_11]